MESTAESISELMNFKWNGYTDNIISSLELSLDNQDFVDVTLVCEGGSIKAHRLVLSACSYFFQRVLKENVCPHPVIVLKGISLSELETLLMFMYHGEARTLKDNVPQLLEAAQFLEIRGLTSCDRSQVFLESKIPSEVTENKTKCISSDVLQTGVHSTTHEFQGLFSHSETYNPHIRNPSQGNNESVYEANCNGRVDIDIKEEPLDEVESNSQDVFRQTVSSQTQLPSKTKCDNNINTCLPKTNFTIQENEHVVPLKKFKFQIAALGETQKQILDTLQSIQRNAAVTAVVPVENAVVPPIVGLPVENIKIEIVNDVDINDDFPINSLEKLRYIEDKLKNCQDGMYRAVLIQHFSKYGGRDMKHCIKELMARLLMDEVSLQYSWLGWKKKRVFKDLHLAGVICDIVRANFPQATHDDAAVGVKSWLVRTRERMERAKQRMNGGETKAEIE